MVQKFKGKSVLLVDDSIVRGTTSREIVLMAREAGATKVYFASCAPPITNAHIYGIDLASSSELIAHQRDAAAIADHIGADGVIFQTLEDLTRACASLSPRETQNFEVGVFCGKYVTPVDDGYFDHIDRIRGERKQAKVLDNARAAVLHGTANPQQVRMAAKGVEVDPHGNVIPSGEGELSPEWQPVNADGIQKVPTNDISNLNSGNGPENAPVTNVSSQDISLHNQNDY
jgi:amidophosphoribosyltransferase